MRKSILILAALVLTMYSCKNEVKNQEAEEVVTDTDMLENDTKTPEIACFKYMSAKDTVTMELEKMNKEVAGTLTYNYYEKDKNDGTLEGQMKGDTLFAQYTFGSEGTTSVREVAFLNKDGKMIEGYGEVEEVNGKFQFKKGTRLTFNDKMPLTQGNCDEN